MRIAKETIHLDITDPKSIAKTIKYFEKMRDELPKKCEQLVNMLADLGIQTALISTIGNELADYILFSKELKSSDKGQTEMIMFGRDIGEVFGEGVDAAQISPILMLEFGAGKYAVPPQSLLDSHIEVGRGSFPGQTHAWDEKGWWYTDKNGVSHHSYGTHPQYPIQHAHDLMETQVDNCIRKVFG